MTLNSLTQVGMVLNGGAMRDRTADLLRARQALSQLSYGPGSMEGVWPGLENHAWNSLPCLMIRAAPDTASSTPFPIVVGLGGFEPPTSPLSGVRSNQLSYRPKPV